MPSINEESSLPGFTPVRSRKQRREDRKKQFQQAVSLTLEDKNSFKEESNLSKIVPTRREIWLGRLKKIALFGLACLCFRVSSSCHCN